MDKTSYFQSLLDAGLEKFIVEHIDEDDETLLRLCVDYLKRGDDDDSRRL